MWNPEFTAQNRSRVIYVARLHYSGIDEPRFVFFFFLWNTARFRSHKSSLVSVKNFLNVSHFYEVISRQVCYQDFKKLSFLRPKGLSDIRGPELNEPPEDESAAVGRGSVPGRYVQSHPPPSPPLCYMLTLSQIPSQAKHRELESAHRRRPHTLNSELIQGLRGDLAHSHSYIVSIAV